MKKIINYIIVGILVSFAYNCEEDLPSGETNYMSFANSSVVTTVDVGQGSGSIDIDVYTGNKTGSDRALGLMVGTDNTTLDPSAYTVPASVTIPGGTNKGTFTVQLNESGLDFTSGSVLVAFMPNQGIDTAISTKDVLINASLVCPPQNQVTMAVTTDNWPDETSWEITDGSGAIVASGGPYVNPDDDFTTITEDLCLLAGTYTATVYDSYGDGGGCFTVTSNGATLAAECAPDAGGGYPVLTSGSGTFTMN